MTTPAILLLAFLRRLGFWWLSMAAAAMPFAFCMWLDDEPAALFTGLWWSAAAYSWTVSAFLSCPLALFCAALHTADTFLEFRRQTKDHP